jgi:chemosensory pili system protein ChpA (sensor histidine kinase/response regulator)
MSSTRKIWHPGRAYNLPAPVEVEAAHTAAADAAAAAPEAAAADTAAADAAAAAEAAAAEAAAWAAAAVGAAAVAVAACRGEVAPSARPAHLPITLTDAGRCGRVFSGSAWAVLFEARPAQKRGSALWMTSE